MEFIFYAVFGIYCFFIIILCIGFVNVKIFQSVNTVAQTKFSVIIPFRNEADNLPQLLQSLALLDYPHDLFEICLVNDASTDNSVEIINNFKQFVTLKIKLINNQHFYKSPKKSAITTGINQTQFEWIVATDADCLVPPKWLSLFNNFIACNKVDFIASAVAYNTKNSFFDAFQALDFLSLQGATIGAFGIQKAFMCNGANLAYKRSVFTEINGFQGNTNLASGDDVFLLQKVLDQKQFIAKYLKSQDHIVLTRPVNSLKALFAQRIRWASKTTAYRDYFSKILAISVVLINFCLIISVPLVLFEFLTIETILVVWLGKFFIDALLIYTTAKLMSQNSKFKHYILSAIIYPFFAVSTVFASLFKTYQWKERTFNN